MTVVRQEDKVVTRLDQKPRENSCRPAVDPLFRSMASCYGHRCLGVVLTGMGKDGTNGAAALKERGRAFWCKTKQPASWREYPEASRSTDWLT